MADTKDPSDAEIDNAATEFCSVAKRSKTDDSIWFYTFSSAEIVAFARALLARGSAAAPAVTEGTPASAAEPSEKLRKFLNAAAGEGLELDGVDAADLYTAIFSGVGISASEAADPMNYKGMFEAAVSSLAEISAALGIEEEDAACANGNELILEAIARKNEAIMAAVTRPATPPASDAVPPEHAQLMKFYAVDNLSALVDMQARHIERLQMPRLGDGQRAFNRVREG